MQNYKLTKVVRYKEDKEGNPLKTKDGRSYVRVNIQTAEHGAKWISGFGTETNSSWKEGDEVEITIKENGQYLNFSEPKKVDVVSEKLEQILNKLTQMNLILQSMREYVMPHKKEQGPVHTEIEYPEEDLGEPPF